MTINLKPENELETKIAIFVCDSLELLVQIEGCQNPKQIFKNLSRIKPCSGVYIGSGGDGGDGPPAGGGGGVPGVV